MAIKTSQGFEITSNEPIDANLALTKEQMRNVNENTIPDKYLTICQDDGKVYLYNKENTPNETTGKFRVFEGGGSGGISDYEALENQPQINSVTLMGNKTGEDLNLQDKMAEITNQDIDKIIFGGN